MKHLKLVINNPNERKDTFFNKEELKRIEPTTYLGIQLVGK